MSQEEAGQHRSWGEAPAEQPLWRGELVSDGIPQVEGLEGRVKCRSLDFSVCGPEMANSVASVGQVGISVSRRRDALPGVSSASRVGVLRPALQCPGPCPLRNPSRALATQPDHHRTRDRNPACVTPGPGPCPCWAALEWGAGGAGSPETPVQ